MKTEREIREAMERLDSKDKDCPACRRGALVCMNFSHVVHGTYRSVLEWVLGERSNLTLDSEDIEDTKLEPEEIAVEEKGGVK